VVPVKVAVVGGTGVAGAFTVAALRERGHDAVVIARSTGVDVATGAGLADALRGVDAVVDTSNIAAAKARTATAFFETTARNLTAAAAQAGVGHVVALSIVGIDRVPLGYYQGKLAQEKALAGSSVPVSILRATQFHEFPVQYLKRVHGRWVFLPRWTVQPVAAREVGALLAELATGAPTPITELAGPRVENMADLARRVIAARGEKRRVVQARVPGKLGRALASGGSVPDRPGRRGTQTFADWLLEQDAGH
jgi:uncharacterized protein YbjT (DUF2867 family)